MNNLADFIESGILELYVLGQLNVQGVKEVESMLVKHPEIQKEIDEISSAIEKYTYAHAVEPDPTVKPFLLASIDYMTRLENGELASFPPLLNENSKVSDYSEWLEREDLQLNHKLAGIHAHIIGHTPHVLSAIVWLEDGAPPETHSNEFEKFLIVEGSCDITVGDKVYHMSPGSQLSIPLYISHFVKVTSEIPCKILLQRVAA